MESHRAADTTGRRMRRVESNRTVHDRTDQGSLNQRIAAMLREAADLLERQKANPFRVQAYRRAAETVVQLEEDVLSLLARGGLEALDALPGIGPTLAGAIAQMARTGRWAQLERLRRAVSPGRLFETIPGLGSELARRIHERLHVNTLEALENAAHDRRLETVPGIGPRRAAMVRATLAGMLARMRRAPVSIASEPAVEILLDVDREYAEKNRRGELPKIAPRRFNPAGEAWLPVLHTKRGEWHVTALFSNTARAHELGRTRDWVVVYFSKNGGAEGQRTIVTETHGPLAGRRVVRGREAECLARPQPEPA